MKYRKFMKRTKEEKNYEDRRNKKCPVHGRAKGTIRKQPAFAKCGRKSK
jgi:hypothetical protein